MHTWVWRAGKKHIQIRQAASKTWSRQKAKRHSPARPYAAIVSAQFMPNSVAGNIKMKAKQISRGQKSMPCSRVERELLSSARLPRCIRTSGLLEPKVPDQFNDTPAFVHGRNLRVMTGANVRIRNCERWVVDQVCCVRGQVETHTFV
jgi:hypothetical protein